MKYKCCVAIINHTDKLTDRERHSIDRAIDVFGGNRDIFIVLPNSINIKEYDYYSNNSKIIKVNDEWLSTYKAYNKTLCSSEFYELFKDYDYILIYQTDCWVFEDKLDYFMELGYDYYGAPWPIYNDQVGNGGFSLRNVTKMIELTTNYTYDGRFNEDGWFCLTHKNDLNICDLDNACNFSMEIIDNKYLPKIKTFPMGLHSSRVYHLWDENGSKFIKFKKKQLSIKISIITVNLNNVSGLKKTIESVINQTVFNKNIEYIVIDGGSTDGSVNVIEKYKDKLHYYVSEKDNGIYEAMNKGVSHATGEYCLFLNSGDKFCENNVIEQAIPYLEEDVVYGNLLLNGKTKKLYPDNINVDYFSYESLPHPSSFIKTQLLRDNPYQTKYGIISDWIFFRESVARGKKFKHIDLIVSDFYLGGASSNVKNVESEKKMYFGGYGFDYEICVVIPCYNQGKYIKETIDSLKAQIYEDFHCVIVNDGSTDNSEEVILENIRGDKRFEYYKNENHGLSYTRNFGIGKTNSKYILCLDSDDKISTAYIECAVRYLNKHPETSLFYGNALMLYDDGKMNFWKLPKFSYSLIFKMNTIYCSSVYRRKDYERVGGYDETMKAYEDWEFLIRLLHNNDNIYKTDDIVFYYRRHNDSMDANAKKDVVKYKEYIIEKNKRIYDELRKNESPITLIKCMDNDGFYGYMYSLKKINPNIIDNKKYIVICQNGKKFNITDNTMTTKDLFTQYDAVVPKPLILKQTVKEDYTTNHNIEDLEAVEKIINEKYQSYANPLKVFLNGNILIPYNMFIMKVDDFKEYTKFIFGVLDEYLNVIDADKLKKVKDSKVGEYLAERLTNVFLIKKYTKMKTFPVILTEEKYKKTSQ